MQQLVGVKVSLIAQKTRQGKLAPLCIVALFAVVKYLAVLVLERAVQILLRCLELLLQKFSELQGIKVEIVGPALFAIGQSRILDDEVVVQ